MPLLERAILLLALAGSPALAAEPPTMSASAVQAAASAVAADPLLPGTETTKTLRFKREEDEKEGTKKSNARWWADFMGNLSAGLRVAIWLLGAALLILVLLRLRDWLGQGTGAGALAALPPTHVGTLDIRPASLPADIGAAARALWLRGEQRAALSLLYRGALSRLVHGQGVPIRAASTESECLTLASARLAAPAQDFLVQLVTGWQTVAYAQRALAPEQLEALCQGFDAHLPEAPA
ncbi:MAG: DUF4129 domain-containing protein [Inhella sp.]